MVMEQLDSDRQQQSSISAIGASNSPDLVLKQASPFKIWLACLSTALHQENTIPDDFEILHSITASSSQPPPTTLSLGSAYSCCSGSAFVQPILLWMF
mmetsp:Transcript_30315/g.60852  ORF Transcript_30315/g.60852 Transcript_30315/m.60852 type:complete len:98 (+) Transcript_30315:188-481(+)